MRLSPWSPAVWVFAPLLGACNSTATAGADASVDGAPADSGGASDAGSDSSGGSPGEEVTAFEAGPELPSENCAGDAGGCLFGTMTPVDEDGGRLGLLDATTDPWVATPNPWTASLYRTFPSAGIEPVATETVARDSTWAFAGLPAWAHYYVAFEPRFNVDAGVSEGAATRIGPLAVGAGAGSAVAVGGKPVQLDVFEESAAGSPLEVESASAQVVEIDKGTSTVAITIGTTTTALPWTPLPNQTSAYFKQFANPPTAQPTYLVTTQTSGAATASWNLVADTPTFTGTITSPAANATVPVGEKLTVTWTVQPDADYQVVALFQQVQGSWTSVYASPQTDTADVRQETIPASRLATPGLYLLNVTFTKANCPATADGCVHASTAESEQITAK